MSEDLRFREEQIRKREAALASRVHLQRDFGELRVTYRWFGWKRLLLHLPGVILGLLIGGMFIWSEIVSPLDSAPDLFVRILGGGMLIVCLLGVYLMTAVIANRTTIEIDSDRLSVHQGPLPYPGNCSAQRSELGGIISEKTSKIGIPLILVFLAGGGVKEPEASFYQLRAILKDGRKLDLLFGSDEYIIRHIEATIAKHLCVPYGTQVLYYSRFRDS